MGLKGVASNLFVAAIFLIFSFLILFANKSKAAEADIEISYGQISSEIHQQLNTKLSEIYGINCGNEPNTKRTPSRYKCGELPYGKILGPNQKEILKMTIPKGRIKNISGGFVDLVNNINFQVLMGRAQSYSQADISMIDFKKPIDIALSNRIDRDFFLRMTPKYNELNTLACGYLPGFKITIPGKTFKFYGQQKKRFLFFSKTFKFSASADVTPGYAHIAHIKVCGVFKTKLVGDSLNSLKPKTELVSISTPQVASFKVIGLKVKNAKSKIHGWLSNLISNILKTFGIIDAPKLIRKELVKALRKEIDKNLDATESEVKNGAWFRKMVSKIIGRAKVKNNIMASFRASINSSTSGPKIYEEKVEDQCYKLAQRIEDQNGIRLDDQAVEDLCMDLSVEVTIDPFSRATIYADRGCYGHFFTTDWYKRRSERPINDNWKTKCKITTRVEINGPNSLEDSRQCVLDSMISGNDNDLNKCRESFIEDLTDLESLNELRKVINSDDPEQTLKEMGFTTKSARNIVRTLGL